jgi:hypothetical protein
MDSTTIDPALQDLLDKAARLKRRLTFRADATKQLQKRYDNLTALIAGRVPAAAATLSSFASKTSGGGTSYNLAAAGGANVRVTQPAAKLLGKISGPLVRQLKELVGRKLFDRLFVTHYTCQKNIRMLALQELEKPIAEQLIALVEEPAVATVTIT